MLVSSFFFVQDICSMPFSWGNQPPGQLTHIVFIDKGRGHKRKFMH